MKKLWSCLLAIVSIGIFSRCGIGVDNSDGRCDECGRTHMECIQQGDPLPHGNYDKDGKKVQEGEGEELCSICADKKYKIYGGQLKRN